MEFHAMEVTTIEGRRTTLAEWGGQVLLIVNVTSRCGFTPQYAGLEALWRQYGPRGLVVMGFPCNQFGRQEPAAEPEIQAFCSSRYGVSFPLFAKLEVNGPQAHPLFRLLKDQAPGMLGTSAIKWNFTKFLVDRTGQVRGRYGAVTSPASLAQAIEALL